MSVEAVTRIESVQSVQSADSFEQDSDFLAEIQNDFLQTNKNRFSINRLSMMAQQLNSEDERKSKILALNMPTTEQETNDTDNLDASFSTLPTIPPHPSTLRDSESATSISSEESGRERQNTFVTNTSRPDSEMVLQQVVGKPFEEMDNVDFSAIAFKMALSLEIIDRQYRLRKYKNVFLGNDCVSFLVENKYAENEDIALQIGNKMIRQGFFAHVSQEHLLENKKLFYRFLTTSVSDLSQTPVPDKRTEKMAEKAALKAEKSEKAALKAEKSDAKKEASLSRKKTKKMDEKKQPSTDMDFWEELSKWLQSLKFRSIPELPKTFEVPENSNFQCPGFADKNHKMASVVCERRFNSRKVPHMVTLVNVDGDTKRYIYKQDDDISMDVAVMTLLKKSNMIWQNEGLKTFTRTYDIVSCPDLTGFGEIVPGETMLNLKSENIVANLAGDEQKWENFYNSLVAVVVTTAAFDITDRHHNNVIFAPDGDIALIDLSASLGNAAPLDSTFKINPIYYPARIRKVHNIYMKKCVELGLPPKSWNTFAADASRAYFAIHNDSDMTKITEGCGYDFLQPWKFMYYLSKRQNDEQGREHARNLIVNKMDNSTAFNNFVAGITTILPIN